MKLFLHEARPVDEFFELHSERKVSDELAKEIVKAHKGRLGVFKHKGEVYKLSTELLHLESYRLIVGGRQYIESAEVLNKHFESQGYTKYDPSKADKKMITFLPLKSTIEDVPNDTMDQIEILYGPDGFVKRLTMVVDASTMTEISMTSLNAYAPVFTDLIEREYVNFASLHTPYFINSKYTFWRQSKVIPFGNNVVGHEYESMLQFTDSNTMQLELLYSDFLDKAGFTGAELEFGVQVLCNKSKLETIFSTIVTPDAKDYENNTRLIENLLGCSAGEISHDKMDYLFDDVALDKFIIARVFNLLDVTVTRYGLLPYSYLESKQKVPMSVLDMLPKGITGSFNINGTKFEIAYPFQVTYHKSNVMVGAKGHRQFVKTVSKDVNDDFAMDFELYAPDQRDPAKLIVTNGHISVEPCEAKEDSVVVSEDEVVFVIDKNLIGDITFKTLSTYLPYVNDTRGLFINNSLELNPFFSNPEALSKVGVSC